MENPVDLLGLQVSRHRGIANKLAGLAKTACEIGTTETDDNARSEWAAAANLVMAMATAQACTAADTGRRMDALRSMDREIAATEEATPCDTSPPSD